MKAEYITHMGDDLMVANAARVSFDKQSGWIACTKHNTIGFDMCECEYPPICEHMGGPGVLSDRDTKLIRYLAKHNHWTPFSHCMITMRETVPIFVARQRFKHMVGFTYNEVSRRYVDSEPEFHFPGAWRKRADNKKQGSSEETLEFFDYWEDEYSIPAAYEQFVASAEELYCSMLEAGVCPEQARMVLPQSMMTSYYVTGSLAAWARAYKLRSQPDSQAEIRELALQWDEIIRPHFPFSWEALTNE